MKTHPEVTSVFEAIARAHYEGNIRGVICIILVGDGDGSIHIGLREGDEPMAIAAVGTLLHRIVGGRVEAEEVDPEDQR
jgi:hypothetical protein